MNLEALSIPLRFMEKSRKIPEYEYYDPPISKFLPEKWLCVAIIEQAIVDVFSSKAYPRLACRARKWIIGDLETEGFTFEFCCGVLGLDVDILRQKIFIMEKKPKFMGKKKIRDYLRTKIYE
jgi:hypothetical protein